MEGTKNGSSPLFNINLELPTGMTMDDIDFHAKFYAYDKSKSVDIPKSGMERIDANNYVAKVDTGLIGPGEIFVEVYADLPYNNDTRAEIPVVSTNTITI